MCHGRRFLVTAGALWLAAFFCVVAIHQPKPGANGLGLFDGSMRFPHRIWHHHGVGTGNESAAGLDLDNCAICVARAGFRGVAATTAPTHPAGDHGQAIRLTPSRHPMGRSTRHPTTRGPPLA